MKMVVVVMVLVVVKTMTMLMMTHFPYIAILLFFSHNYEWPMCLRI